MPCTHNVRKRKREVEWMLMVVWRDGRVLRVFFPVIHKWAEEERETNRKNERREYKKGIVENLLQHYFNQQEMRQARTCEHCTLFHQPTCDLYIYIHEQLNVCTHFNAFACTGDGMKLLLTPCGLQVCSCNIFWFDLISFDLIFVPFYEHVTHYMLIHFECSKMSHSLFFSWYPSLSVDLNEK